MTAVSKNAHFDGSDNIVSKYNNTVHRSIYVTSNSYVEYNEDFNKKGPKFKVGDQVKISKYKNIFAKEYTPNWPEKELQKTNQEKFRIEKALKRKGDKISNGKGIIIHLIVGKKKSILS